MKRILIALIMAAPLPALADEAKVAISVSLIEEVFRSLSTQPYANVASTIAKLQAEVQRQQPSASPQPSAPPAPTDSKEK